MIPLQVLPLTDLTVLVTRPREQAGYLCERIETLGGRAIALATLEITPCNFVMPEQAHELVIFTSVNAVKHGLAVLKSQIEMSASPGFTPRIAAVGAATTAALTEQGYRVDITPAVASSEGLLADQALQIPPAQVLIVRGRGGRELLRETFGQRGSLVTVCEVYARAPAQPEPTQLSTVLELLRKGELDIITATSVDTLLALHALLSPADQDLVHCITVLAGSARIAAQAKQLGWSGDCIISATPEDKELLGTLLRWRTRARN